jgi:hypothetical protein
LARGRFFSEPKKKPDMRDVKNCKPEAELAAFRARWLTRSERAEKICELASIQGRGAEPIPML